MTTGDAGPRLSHRSFRLRFLVALLSIPGLILVSLADCRAESPPLLGIGAADHRVRVMPTGPPWDAVAKVQTNIGSHCTGVLVAPGIVLTAAHCLYNERTRALLQPVSLHVLLGFESGDYRWHALVRRYVTGSEFDGAQPGRHREADWARLELASPIPPAIAPLAVSREPPEPGLTVALAGYNRDQRLLLIADLACRITAVVALPEARQLAHNCSATFGTSGGPVLAQSGSLWQVVGINIGASAADNVALWAAAFANVSCAGRAC